MFDLEKYNKIIENKRYFTPQESIDLMRLCGGSEEERLKYLEKYYLRNLSNGSRNNCKHPKL